MRPSLSFCHIQGVTLLEKLGSSDGRWRVRLERLGDGDAPTERVVSAAAIGALPNWPFLGVSVACLRAFARAHEALLVDATTEDVCERVCKPLTETAGDSLAACLVRLGAADPVTGVPLAAAPTIFVSHARKYLFRDLVDAVCAHVSSLPEEEHERHYVWLDIFSQYQHWIGDVGTAQRPCNWDVVFQLTTAAIGHTCLVFAPWRDAVPLRRAWMLWEVLCTLTARRGKGGASSALRVRLPPAESDDFQAALVNEFDVIAASVAHIDSRSAECFTREDQAMVHAAIDRTLKGGHTELDARLSEALREWLAAEGRAALARMPCEERATLALQNQLGMLLHAQGKLDEAEPLLREALEAQRATLGDRHPDTLGSMNNLGVLLRAQGKLDEAEQLVREALEARRALGDRHPDTLGSINNLAEVLKAQGKLDEAEPLLREALRSKRATLGDRHPNTLISINNLGRLLQAQGKLDEAEPLLREALEASRATLGDRHPHTLGSINNLGNLLQAQSKVDEAEPLVREALEAQRATLGDRHPHTLVSISSLGVLLQAQRKLDEAEPLVREALEAMRATLGDRHRDTLTSINNLGSLLQAQGKLDEAEPLYRQALEAQRATLDDRHPDTLSSINNLGSLLQAQGKLHEALPLYRKALEGRRATLGDRHPHTLLSIDSLGRLLQDQGKFDEAELLFREALEARRATLGDRHPDTLACINIRGVLLRAQGKLDEAEPLLREALEARRATLGDRHPDTLISITSLGALLYDQGGKLDEAEPLLREALEAQRATLGDRHPNTLISIYSLAVVLKAQGKLDEALPLLVEHCRATLGDLHPDTIKVMDLHRALESKRSARAPLVGKQVLVHGLVAKPELNHRTGTAASWDSERGRYSVRLQDGSTVALKPANLRQLDTAQELHAPAAQPAAATRATPAAAQPAGGAAAFSAESVAVALGTLHSAPRAAMTPLQRMQNDPQVMQLIAMKRHNSALVEPLLRQLAASNLPMLQLIHEHQADFTSLLNGTAPPLAAPPPAAHGGTFTTQGGPFTGADFLPTTGMGGAPARVETAPSSSSPNPSAGRLVGEQVLVHGLVAKPELNNRTGTAAGWDSEHGRYSVRLQDGSLLSFKPANLRQLDTPQEPQPGTQSVPMARVSTDRPCPTRHLAIAPPYDWSRTYMAAKDMEEYLPGVPLDATLVEATEDGFDVLASDGVTSLVHVVVERRRHQPLRPGDPVVATVAGVGLEGDLLREGRPGEWVVRARSGGDQQPVEEITVPASDVTFSWRVGRDMWMKAVRLAPLRLAARKADWLGIGSLELDIYGSPRTLSAGDPAALFGLQDEPELNGQVRGRR